MPEPGEPKFEDKIEEPTPEAKEPKVDIELPPEAVEKAMEKVRDITQTGNAYSYVASGLDACDAEVERKREEKFVRILSEGLLGTNTWGEGEDKDEAGVSPSKVKWLKNKKNKKALVHFNITGRSHAPEEIQARRFYKSWNGVTNPITEIPFSSWLGQISGYAILFDLDSFKEEDPLTPVFNDEGNDHPMKEERHRFIRKNGTFRNACMYTQNFLAKEMGIDKFDDGLTHSNTEYGFILSPRVSHRLFTGLIISAQGSYGEHGWGNWVKKEDGYDYYEPIFPPSEIVEKRIQSLVELQKRAYGKNPSSYLPVYDAGGNLRWPKQMSLEEVRKFVAERNKKE